MGRKPSLLRAGGDNRWCIVETENDTFLLVCRSLKGKAKYFYFYVYLFDKDGTVFIDPVSTWTARFEKMSLRKAYAHQAIVEFAEAIASGGVSPYDLRDDRMVVGGYMSLPRGSAQIY